MLAQSQNLLVPDNQRGLLSSPTNPVSENPGSVPGDDDDGSDGGGGDDGSGDDNVNDDDNDDDAG